MVRRSGNVSRGTATGCIFSLLLAFALRMRRCQLALKHTTWKAHWLHFSNRLMTSILRLTSPTKALWEKGFYPNPMHTHSSSLAFVVWRALPLRRSWAKARETLRTGVIFLRFSGEREQARGDREVRDTRDGRCAKFLVCIPDIFHTKRKGFSFIIQPNCVIFSYKLLILL